MGCIMTKVIQRRQKQALKLSLPPLLSSNLIMSESDHYFSLQTPPNNQEDMTEVSSDDFEKLGVLGHGSSASIYKVRHRKNGSVYALKVLRREEGGSMMNPVHEAEILSNLYSEFLVRCHGLIHDEGKLCLVMEYMEHGSLHGVLKTHGWMPEGVISMVARRVLNGLRYLHGMKIVHRDIKPSNLLINGKGEIKIADFGVSTKVMVEWPDPCETTQGTWAYMSPERFDPEKWGGGGRGGGGGGSGGGGDGGGGSRGYAGDVWSLGLVLFECFVGQYPLIGPGRKPDWASLSCAICFGGPVELPEGMSPDFLSFLRRCLEKDWRKRGTVSELLRHPFVNASGCDPNKDGLRYLLKH